MPINRLYSKQIKTYDLKEKDTMSKKEMTIGEACRTILKSGRDAILGIFNFKEFTLTDDEWDGSRAKGYTKEHTQMWLDSVEKKPKRARTAKGKFKADDKVTKDFNEAWVGGKAPKKKKRKTRKKNVKK